MIFHAVISAMAVITVSSPYLCPRICCEIQKLVRFFKAHRITSFASMPVPFRANVIIFVMDMTSQQSLVSIQSTSTNAKIAEYTIAIIVIYNVY